MNSCRDLKELHPVVKVLAEKLIAECEKQGLKIGISETYRSIERQDYLYSQGRTRPGNVVTNAKGSSMSSYHQWRLAFDFFQNIKGKEYDPAFMQKVGKIGQSLGLEWGGSWTGFKDTPHFQYTFGLSITDLKSGKKPPEQVQVEQLMGELKKTVIILNGVEKEVQTYFLDGYNYIKLQDLKCDKIDIGYNGKPVITTK